MKKQLKISLFIIIVCSIFFMPNEVFAARQVVKECKYADDNSAVTISIYSDATLKANVTKFDGVEDKNEEKVQNATSLKDEIRNSNSFSCPKYALPEQNPNLIGEDRTRVWAATSSEEADKIVEENKGWALAPIKLGLIEESFVDNDTGMTEAMVTCTYDFTSANMKTGKIQFRIFPNDAIGMSFESEQLSQEYGNKLFKSLPKDFEEKFKKETKSTGSDSAYECPAITATFCGDAIADDTVAGEISVHGQNNEASCDPGVCLCRTMNTTAVTVSEEAQANGITASIETTDDDGDDLTENEGLNLDNYDKEQTCNSIFGETDGNGNYVEGTLGWIIQKILNWIKIIGPLLVIVLSGIDFAKAIMISDDESIKKAQRKLIIRLVAAIGLFLIPTLVILLLEIFNGSIEDPTCSIK